jgi:hypothetical protein
MSDKPFNCLQIVGSSSPRTEYRSTDINRIRAMIDGGHAEIGIARRR